MSNFFDVVSKDYNNKISPNEYSPLILAYIGDAVFEILVRSMVIENGNTAVNNLHKKSSSFVSAKAQAQMFEKIKTKVTPEELAVLKRGRNAKSFTSAKNASITDYRHATGVEALFGYLYLKGDFERINFIFEICKNYKNNEEIIN